MTASTDDDGFELDYIDVYTRQRLREGGVINYPHSLLAQIHRVDGVMFEMAFTSLKNLADWVLYMNPRRANVYCGRDEDSQLVRNELNGIGQSETVH